MKALHWLGFFNGYIFCAVQEEKIASLQSFADQLIGADHYAKPDIFNRRNEVLDR